MRETCQDQLLPDTLSRSFRSGISSPMTAGKRPCAATGRVLVLGDDMRIFLTVARSLGRAGLEVHAVPFNWHSPALRSRYVAKVHRLCRYSDDAAAWQSAFLALVTSQDFDLVIPCCDRATIALDASRDMLASQRLAIPNRAAMTTLFDKEQTRKLCLELGISVVKAGRLDASAGARDLVARFGLPLVIKPRRSFWADKLDVWEKVAIPASEAEVAELLAGITHHDRFQVEAFFDGVGVGVSVLAHEGRIVQAFQHRRLREGKAGPSSYRISEAVNPGLLEACAKICRHTAHTGVCMFEFRYNPERRDWILIETNARFWGSMALPIAIGVDFPRYLYDLMVNDVTHPRVAYEPGIRSRNFFLDGLNLLRRARHLAAGGAWLKDVGDFLAQPAGWLTGRERSDSFVLDDLKPGLWECATFAGAIARKFARRHAAPARREADHNLQHQAAAAA